MYTFLHAKMWFSCLNKCIALSTSMRVTLLTLLRLIAFSFKATQNYLLIYKCLLCSSERILMISKCEINIGEVWIVFTLVDAKSVKMPYVHNLYTNLTSTFFFFWGTYSEYKPYKTLNKSHMFINTWNDIQMICNNII